MLDAIVCPEREFRYYSFNASWGAGESMGSMRNGSGDHWFIHFSACGSAIKGLAHEAAWAADQALARAVQRSVPRMFSSFLAEPAFDMDRVTFCYWREVHEPCWHQVVHPDPATSFEDDGSNELLALLISSPAAYADFTRSYYEIEVPLQVIEALYDHVPLTEALIQSINPKIAIDSLRADAAEIGYPIAASEHRAP